MVTYWSVVVKKEREGSQQIKTWPPGFSGMDNPVVGSVKMSSEQVVSYWSVAVKGGRDRLQHAETQAEGVSRVAEHSGGV